MAGPIVRWPVAADKLSGTRDSTRPRRLRRTAAILACLVAAASCTPQPPSDPPPSPATTAPPATPTPSPKPTPTPTSERERALAESKQTYIDFWKALDRMYSEGGADHIPPYLDKFLDPKGPARDAYEVDVRDMRDGQYLSRGRAVLRSFRILDLSKLDVIVPSVKWQVCVDQTKVKVTKGGKPYQHPIYLEERAELRLDKKNGTWLIHRVTSQPLPKSEGCGDG